MSRKLRIATVILMYLKYIFRLFFILLVIPFMEHKQVGMEVSICPFGFGKSECIGIYIMWATADTTRKSTEL